MTGLRMPFFSRRRVRAAGPADARAADAGPGARPVTITLRAGPPGPAIPEDFAGLSFERGPLNPGNAGVPGYLFDPANRSLVTLFRNAGLRNLRVGGGSVDQFIPAGTGRDGFTGVDNLFAFAAEAGVQVIYTFRLLNPRAKPIPELKSINAQAAAHIWGRYRENVASFAIGNEPDWHDFHSYAGRPLDPAIYEDISGVPGSAYPSYLATWHSFADAVAEAAPGAPLTGPDTGAYSPMTWTPDPHHGVSWTERFAADERGSGRLADVTQHYYVGGGPGKTAARQAISNMLSPEWVHGTAVGTQPQGTTYTPYPWFYENHLAPVAAAGLPYRLTEANDYLGGVPGASDAFASALWALDYLHWWAAHGAGGVNFHNKQWLYTDTIVPGPAGPGEGYAVTPKGYGIKAFTLGSAGRVRPVAIENTDGVNLTAYGVEGASWDYVTIINKSQGRQAADAAVTIAAAGPGEPGPGGPGPGGPGAGGPGAGGQGAQVMTLAGAQPGDATGGHATLGGTVITGGTPWDGTWSRLPADPGTTLSLTVRASTAVIVRIPGRS